MKRAAAVAAVLLLAAAAGAETRFTLGDSFEAGADRFWGNTFSVGVEPSDRLSFDLVLGASHSGTRVTDTSAGLGITGKPGEALTAGLRFDRFNGARGFRLEDADPTRDVFLDATGEVDARQRTNTWSGTLRARVFGAGEEEEAEREDRVFRALDVDAGLSLGRLTIPTTLVLRTATLPGTTRFDERNLGITQRQWDASFGIVATVTATELGVSYRRSHFGDLVVPDEYGRLPAAARDRLFGEVRSAVSWVLSEPTLYASTASLYEPFSDAFSVYASWSYARLLVSRGIARTLTVEASWHATDRLSLRLGGMATREAGTTRRYGTAGVTFTF